MGLLMTNTKDDGLSSVDDALNVVHDGTAFTTLDMINVLLTLIPNLFSPFAYLWFYREEETFWKPCGMQNKREILQMIGLTF